MNLARREEQPVPFLIEGERTPGFASDPTATDWLSTAQKSPTLPPFALDSWCECQSLAREDRQGYGLEPWPFFCASGMAGRGSLCLGLLALGSGWGTFSSW